MAFGYVLSQFYCMQGECVETIFLECRKCKRKTEIKYNHHEQTITDKQAAKIFKERGWTIKPTLCPSHAGVNL
jgi:hypothetical protein